MLPPNSQSPRKVSYCPLSHIMKARPWTGLGSSKELLSEMQEETSHDTLKAFTDAYHGSALNNPGPCGAVVIIHPYGRCSDPSSSLMQSCHLVTAIMDIMDNSGPLLWQ